MRLSPSIGRRYAMEVFKRALTSAESETLRNATLVAKTLEYTGFLPGVGVTVRLREKAVNSDISRLLQDEMSEADLSAVLGAFDAYRKYSKLRGHSEYTTWVDLYGSGLGPDRRGILGLLKHEFRLKRMDLIQDISITLARGNELFRLDEASSGEISLLATHCYIGSHIQEIDTILIDEPENSLHPRWQREYCRRLLDLFYLYSPRIVVATHSPHIVQGAQSSDVAVRLVRTPSDEETLRPLTKSIEGTLFEVFGVLSPANHYLSEKVTFILNEIVQKRSSLGAARVKLRELRELSEDQEQREFLDRAIALAGEVEEKVKARGGIQ